MLDLLAQILVGTGIAVAAVVPSVLISVLLIRLKLPLVLPGSIAGPWIIGLIAYAIAGIPAAFAGGILFVLMGMLLHPIFGATLWKYGGRSPYLPIPDPALLTMVMFVSHVKNSLPPLSRSFMNVNGAYVQGGVGAAGEVQCFAGGDPLVPDLVFVVNYAGNSRVSQYTPGDWEFAVKKLFAKAQRVKAAVDAKDKDACLAALQTDIDVPDEAAFRHYVGAEFETLA